MLTDWTDEDPGARLREAEEAVRLLQLPPAHGRRLLPRRPRATASAPRSPNGAMWGEMRMSAADLADVTGYTYTYLMNGQRAGRQLDGAVHARRAGAPALHQRLGDVVLRRPHPRPEDDRRGRRRPARARRSTVDEFRIAVAETFDVIVEPSGQDAFTIFAQAMDRTGFAAGTLAVRDGLRAPVPDLDPRPVLTMADMGHGDHDGAPRAGGRPARRPRPCRPHPPRRSARRGHDMSAMAAACSRIPASETGQPARRHADDDADLEARRSRASACATTADAC